MRICNGCEYLLCDEDEGLLECECKHPHYKFGGNYIGMSDKDVPIPTPDWCPKKNENIQKEALNVN
jgi:hypothetical protein